MFLNGFKFIVFFLIPQLNVRDVIFQRVGGGIHYLVAYNSSVSRGLDTNWPPLLIELRWKYQGPKDLLKLDKLSDVV